MSELIFKGVATALVTPFDKENKVEYGKLEELIEYQISQGCDALLVGGTTGECATLTDDELYKVVSFAAKTVNGRVPLIAGAGSNCTAKAAEECAAMEKAGADALLVITPYYNKCNERGLFLHFKECAQKTGLPMIVYNVPSRTGVNIRPEAYAGLLKIKNVKAVKECSGLVEQSVRIKSLYRDEIAVYCGSDELTLPLLSAGAAGAVSVLSNLFPKAVHELCARFFAGDIDRSIAIQQRFSKLIKLLFADVNPIPIKTAMNLEGFSLGGFRLPLCEADGDLKEKLSAELKALRAGN